ncbi:MAG: LamG domain-containing protein, partial [Elusimicrobia bacterium]|nr:LamG domain-containing protein [Elusimicrobiota bacterium]
MRIKKTIFFLGIIFLFLLKGVLVAGDVPSLVGHWDFESSLNLADATGNFTNGTVVGGVSWNAGEGAASFDGTGYIRLTCPSNVDLTDGCIIEARVYFPPDDPWAKTVFGGFFGNVGYSLSGQYFAYNPLGGWVALNCYTIPGGQWIILKGERQGGKLKIYVDGVEQQSMDDPGYTPNLADNRVYIGNCPGIDWCMQGYIKWVKLYTFQDLPDKANLTISAHKGGSIVLPSEGTGTYEYDLGTVVDIQAAAADKYHFKEWKGDTGKIDDPYNASTTIRMDGSYTIYATFESDTPMSESLIGWWDFTTSIDVVDKMGYFPQGTCSSGVSWNAGMQAASFNGTSGYMQIIPPEELDLTDGCAIEARVYITPDHWTKAIFGGYFGAIGYHLNGQYFGYTKGPWTTLSYTLPSNQWVTVKAVRNAGQLKIYINDQLLEEMDDPDPPPHNPIVDRKIYIGDFPGFDWFFQGYIQWVKLYTFGEKTRDEWIEDLEAVYIPTNPATMGNVSNNPGMLLNEVPIPGSTGYFGYLFTEYGFWQWPDVSSHETHLNKLTLAGVNIQQAEAWIDLDVPGGKVQMHMADEQISAILERNPETKFLLRVGFRAGDAFASRHPTEVVKFNDGTTGGHWNNPAQAYLTDPNTPRYSLASHVWERQAAQGLVDLAKVLSTKSYKDSVIGIIIGAGTCGQWLWWGDFNYETYCIDFSDIMLQRYKEYAEEKYVTVSALRAAWNNASVTFDTITIPTLAERGVDVPNSVSEFPPVSYQQGQFGYFRNPGVGNNQRVVDYYISMSRELSRRMIYLCRTFKTATDNKMLTGAFYGPTGIIGYKMEGQSYFDEVLASEWIDFWADPWAYQGRWEGEPLYVNAPMGSLLLHNKTYLIEADLRTSELGYRDLGSSLDEWGDLMMFRKSFIRSVTNGAYSYWFEMQFDGWFENDTIFQGIAEASEISTLAMSLDRTRNTEIAVIYDGASLLYASDWLDYIALVRQTIQGLG